MSAFPTIGIYPVPILPDGRHADVSSGWKVRSDGKLHRGADILYRRRAGEPTRSPNGAVPTGVTRDEPGGWYMPNGIPALAPWAGRVVVSEERFLPDGASRGWAVRLDHGTDAAGDKWETLTGHIVKDSQRVRVGDHVEAADVLGIIGGSDDGKGLKHVHLNLYKNGQLIDPEPWLERWRHVQLESGVGGSVALGLVAAWLVAS